VYATRNICGSRCSHACFQRSEVAKNTHTTSRRPLILGCMDRDAAFAIPRDVIRSCIDNLNTSTKADGQAYWHIHLQEAPSGEISILLPKKTLTTFTDALPAKIVMFTPSPQSYPPR